MRRLQTGLLALVLCMVPVLAGCGLGGSSREITVLLPDSAGLFVGNDVGVLGVPVGKVTKIVPAGDHVEIHLDLTNDSVKIPADAGAAVVARSVATDRYVELTPVYSKGATMESGAVIPAERTATPVDFDQVLASLKEFGDGLVDNPQATRSLRELIAVSAKTLKGRGDQLNATIGSLSGAVDVVNDSSDDIFATLRSFDTLTSSLASDSGTVRTFIRNVSAATAFLAQERNTLGVALKGISAAADDVTAFAKTNRALLKKNVVDATSVINNFLKARGDLQELIEVLPLTAQNIVRTINPANGNVRVRANLVQGLPIGNEQFQQLCALLGTACDSITYPPDLGALLGIGG